MAAADPSVATPPRASSRLLPPPGRAAPPKPVCGPPDGSVLLAEALSEALSEVLVEVLVDVLVELLVEVLVEELVDVLDDDEVVIVGVLVGLAEVPVKYVPLGVTVT